MDTTWTRLLIVGAVALATIVVADLALQQICPPLPRRLELRDGLSDLGKTDPTTLILGSSHARAYVVAAQRIEAASEGAHQVVVLPLEWGKLSSYDWVLRNRVEPLLDERAPDGSPVRPSLRRLVLVTEWWDACSPEGGLPVNLPARAWTFADFLRDLGANGLTPFNRTWYTAQWSLATRGSILLSDRGVGRLMRAVHAKVEGIDGLETQEAWQQRVDWWQDMVERNFTNAHCTDGTELAALRDVASFCRERGLELVVILHPRMPSTLTAKAKATTLARYTQEMTALSEELGFRLIDLTTKTPLDDGDFMADFDHVTRAGSEKLADWGFSGDLSLLLSAPAPTEGRP
jgi:hypothetical protein